MDYVKAPDRATEERLVQMMNKSCCCLKQKNNQAIRLFIQCTPATIKEIADVH